MRKVSFATRAHRGSGGLLACRIAVIGVIAVAVSVSSAVGASAKSLTDQQTDVQKAIVQVQQSVSTSQQSLQTTTVKLTDSQTQLGKAQAQLDLLKSQLSSAQKAKTDADAALVSAQEALQAATQKVNQAIADVNKQLAVIGVAVRTQYQQQSPLEGLGAIIGSQTPGELEQRIQWSSAIFNGTSSQLDQLNQLKAQAQAAQQAQAKAEAKVQDQQDAAASKLALVQTLTNEAAFQQAQVAALVNADEKAQDAAQAQLAADQKQYQSLEAKATQIEAAIKKAAAEKKAAAAKAAAEKAAAAKLAAAKAAVAKAEAKLAAQRAATLHLASTRSSIHYTYDPSLSVAGTPERIAQELLANSNISFTGGSLDGVADMENIASDGHPLGCGTYSPYARQSPYAENAYLLALMEAMTQDYKVQIGVVTGYHNCEGAGPGLHESAEAVDLNGAVALDRSGSTTFHYVNSNDDAFIIGFVEDLNAKAEQLGVHLMVTQVASYGASCLTVPGLSAISGGNDSCTHLHVGVMADSPAY